MDRASSPAGRRQGSRRRTLEILSKRLSCGPGRAPPHQPADRQTAVRGPAGRADPPRMKRGAPNPRWRGSGSSDAGAGAVPDAAGVGRSMETQTLCSCRASRGTRQCSRGMAHRHRSRPVPPAYCTPRVACGPAGAPGRTYVPGY